MHKDDNYDPITDVYTIAGVQISRAVFEFFDQSNVGRKFTFVKRDDDGTVTLEQLP